MYFSVSRVTYVIARAYVITRWSYAEGERVTPRLKFGRIWAISSYDIDNL